MGRIGRFQAALVVLVLVLSAGTLFAQEGGWRLAATLQAPTPTADGWFGSSVAMDAQHVIVGEAFGDAGSVRRAGRAYIFTTAGELVAALQSPAPRREANFGGAEWENKLVAVRGNRCAVGEVLAKGSGMVHLFDLGGTLLSTIKSPEPASGKSREFGNSLFMAEDLLLVGAYNVGAWLFDLSGSPLACLKGPGNVARNGFGMAVVLRGDRVLVTQDHAAVDGVRDCGMAHLFDRGGTLVKSLRPPGPAQAGLFGVSAALGDTRIVVGAPESFVDGKATGLAFLFSADGEPYKVLTPPAHSASFGVSVAVDGAQVYVGASGSKVDGQNGAGLVFVYDLEGAYLGTLQAPRAAAGACFGYSVAAADGLLAVGAYGMETDGRNGAGKVYLFARDGG